MKNIFLVYGHYNDNSFNAAIREAFLEEAKEKGFSVDCVDLYKEKLIVLIAPIWNFRMPAIVEGWIDKVLSPPWAFRFKKIIGNYGYPVGNLKGKRAVVFCTYGSPQFAIRTFFLNMPTKRLRRGVFNICGITNVIYKRYFAVPFVSDQKRKKFLEDVRKTVRSL